MKLTNAELEDRLDRTIDQLIENGNPDFLAAVQQKLLDRSREISQLLGNERSRLDQVQPTILTRDFDSVDHQSSDA